MRLSAPVKHQAAAASSVTSPSSDQRGGGSYSAATTPGQDQVKHLHLFSRCILGEDRVNPTLIRLFARQCSINSSAALEKSPKHSDLYFKSGRAGLQIKQPQTRTPSGSYWLPATERPSDYSEVQGRRRDDTAQFKGRQLLSVFVLMDGYCAERISTKQTAHVKNH